MIEIVLPHNEWTPREHQMPLWRYLRGGGKRAMAIWHRRAGKDDVCLHNTAIAAVERPANYAYVLPQFEQGRRAIWTAVNPHTGKRRIDEAFPQELRTSTNETSMSLKLVNGSTISVIGSDTYSNTLVGTSFAGITFSEYALSNPSVWAYSRPILEENDGWAIFITTPRGRNHAFEMFNYAKKRPDWFCELLTVEDTGALTQEQLAETLDEMRALYGEDQGRASFRQELYCDFSAAILGAYFAMEMAAVRSEGRVLEVEAMPGPINTAWDLGVREDTSIWFWQQQGSQLVILDHYAASGAGVEHFAEVIEQKERTNGWTHGTDYVPHDAKIKEWGSGRTRVETMQRLGLNPMLVPMATFADGINAVRRTLPLCVFHPRCEEGGLDALEQYRREWDDEKKAFRATDYHDWTSHPAAAFRYLSLAWRTAKPREVHVPKPEGWTIPPPAPERRGIRL